MFAARTDHVLPRNTSAKIPKKEIWPPFLGGDIFSGRCSGCCLMA
jgi:hypothetical protein